MSCRGFNLKLLLSARKALKYSSCTHDYGDRDSLPKHSTCLPTGDMQSATTSKLSSKPIFYYQNLQVLSL